MNIKIIITLGFILLTWLGALTYLWYKLRTLYGKIFHSTKDPDFKLLLKELQDDLHKREIVIKNLEEKIELLKKDGYDHLQQIGLVRYNPFSDTGGNQSFVLAILDERGSGFVITSLHSRESTRLFAKPVKEGKESGYEFSKEEIQAILEAKKHKRT